MNAAQPFWLILVFIHSFTFVLLSVMSDVSLPPHEAQEKKRGQRGFVFTINSLPQDEKIDGYDALSKALLSKLSTVSLVRGKGGRATGGDF